MPLIHSKKPSAFSKNVSSEMHAGKPQKQALAIAYSVKRHAEHKADGGMCGACGGPCKMAKGGKVEGVNVESTLTNHGQSEAGREAELAKRYEDSDPDWSKKHKENAKDLHHKTIIENRALPKPRLKGLAHGGEVKRKVNPGMEDQGSDYKNDQTRNRVDFSGGQRRGSGEGYPKYQVQAQNEKGVNTPVSGVTNFPGGKGTSKAGDYTKERYGGKPLFHSSDKGGHPAVKEHQKVLSEMREMPNPKLKGLAHGGEVESEDDEIHEMIGPEMMDAIHSKDHKKLMSGIEAMVLHHMSKKGE